MYICSNVIIIIEKREMKIEGNLIIILNIRKIAKQQS